MFSALLIRFCISSFWVVSALAVPAWAVEDRWLHPPQLNSDNIKQEITGIRPVRKGAPNFQIEKKGTQLILHNYGHGGSGWTLAPGSASYVVTQLLDRVGPQAKSEPVTVVGAGVIGLFTALELVDRGFTQVTVVAERYDSLTSHVAGALLAPVSMDNDPQDLSIQKLIETMGMDAYRFYHQVATGSHPHFQQNVRILPTYFSSREESGLEPYVVQKVMEPAKDVTVHFLGTEVSREMVVYDDGIFINTGDFMNDLRRYLEGRVKFETRRIENFSDVPTQFVLNCTGLGSISLNQDSRLTPVQGHLILLKNQNEADLNYMMLSYSEEGVTEGGFEVERAFYFFPKSLPGSGPGEVGVMGGTFVRGYEPGVEEYRLVWKRAQKFFYGTDSNLNPQ